MIYPDPCYRPQRSCGQGNVFTGVCLSTGGRVSASVHAGMPPPPAQADPPPERGRPPRDQADPPRDQGDSPGPGRPPSGPGRLPPDQADPPPQDQADPPPGKQTPAYGLRAAGTHPTGMHSCIVRKFYSFVPVS